LKNASKEERKQNFIQYIINQYKDAGYEFKNGELVDKKEQDKINDFINGIDYVFESDDLAFGGSKRKKRKTSKKYTGKTPKKIGRKTSKKN
jgi:hypothetical protein